MTLNVLFAAVSERWPDYEAPLRRAFEAEGLEVALATELPPDEVDYIVTAPDGWVTDFAPYTRCRAVFNLWAGVEEITDNPTLTQPLVRMVEEGLTRGMVEWVTAQVLRHHLDLDRDVCRNDGIWAPHVPPLARDRKVTLLGLGALGQACAETLRHLEFDVAGWSRSLKEIGGVTAFAGPEGLVEALKRSEILVLLLPQTEETRHVIDAEALARLPEGAVVINPGRGPLIDDGALLEALNEGRVAHATLDVFDEEPLPEDHPFWAHPQVTVTPHVASATRPETSAESIARNIARDQAGDEMVGIVDRSRGY